MGFFIFLLFFILFGLFALIFYRITLWAERAYNRANNFINQGRHRWFLLGSLIGAFILSLIIIIAIYSSSGSSSEKNTVVEISYAKKEKKKYPKEFEFVNDNGISMELSQGWQVKPIGGKILIVLPSGKEVTLAPGEKKSLGAQYEETEWVTFYPLEKTTIGILVTNKW